MDAIFKYILQSIEQLPAAWRVIILAVIGIMMYLFRFFMSKSMQNSLAVRASKLISRISLKDLCADNLFTRKQFYQNKINQITFNEKIKDDIFKIILSAKLEEDLNEIHQFISETKINKLSVNELCDSLHDLTRRMIKSYEDKVFLKLSIKYGEQKAKNIFDFIMNHPEGFRKMRIDRINRIIEFIDENIRVSKIFDNNLERTSAYLYEIHSAIRYTILNAETMFRHLNGELKKIVCNNTL